MFEDVEDKIFAMIDLEHERHQKNLEMIASENYVSPAVMKAQGSILTNKYAEGYPKKRFYHGCEVVDQVEELAIDRAKQLFNCLYVNVQPHSGSQANQSVLLALLKPGDTIMGLDLSAGGHLTHGSKANLSGKWFNVVSYGVDPITHQMDYGHIAALVKSHKPKLIIAGGSAYPRAIDFKQMREIADLVGAYLMVDMAHFAGLVAGKVHENPIPHAHVVTSTTHKTLRGPRGGIILTNDSEIAKKINSAVFPGLQGGPLMHVIAAKAVAFGEALQPSFRKYAQDVIDNAQVLAKTLKRRGLTLVSGGTDTHMVLVDLRPNKLTGLEVADALAHIGIICNKNGIPFDTTSPLITSGIRLGVAAGTTRMLTAKEFNTIGNCIADVIKDIYVGEVSYHVLERNRKIILDILENHPIY